jgi:diketogulonate reductase-like aldo/keto reductase
MNAFEHCIDQGYTRFIGVSNFSVHRLREAQSRLEKHRLVACQAYYNLTQVQKTYFFGLSVTELHSYCKQKDIMLIAWSPLEEGKLTRPDQYPVLDEMTEKYGKTQAQISLNWLISQEKIVTIPKASSIEHIKENAGATGWRMSEEDSRRLQESFCLA